MNPVITTTHDLLSSFNSKSQIDVAILDFSKAFDTVPHAGLLGKLEHYGIDSKILLWITNFLNNRKQRVVVDGSFSNYADVESGVPQGTVLGPLLFLLHINDLPSCVNSKVRLFADDCLLYREIKINQDQIDMQRDLDALMDWGSTWGMKFNAKKCNIMRVSRSRKPLQQGWQPAFTAGIIRRLKPDKTGPDNTPKSGFYRFLLLFFSFPPLKLS